jgi:hypothetical protein
MPEPTCVHALTYLLSQDIRNAHLLPFDCDDALSQGKYDPPRPTSTAVLLGTLAIDAYS